MRSTSIGNQTVFTHQNNVGYVGQVGLNTSANYHVKKPTT